MTTKNIDYRQQLVEELKKKYECTSCGYTSSGELQLWPDSKTCIGVRFDEPTGENYKAVLESVCQIIDAEMISLGLSKNSEAEKEVSK